MIRVEQEPITLGVPELFARFDSRPSRLLSLLDRPSVKLSPSGPWLAGGAIVRALLGEKQMSDLDFFFSGQEQFESFCSGLPASYRKVKGTKAWRKYESERGVLDTLLSRDVPPLQAIRLKFFGSAAEIIEDFDLTCCQFAFDGEYITTTQQAIDDLALRQLRIHRVANPASTMHRAMRMSRRGFFFASGSAGAFVAGIKEAPAEALASALTYDEDDPDEEEIAF